jgi:DNA-binding FadR family transcriptional regulator
MTNIPMNFTPLQPRSLPEQCADRLRRAILSGELPTGERLPPERRLAERLGVNRVTLRSALARLHAEGLLRVRQGSGYTVRPWSEAGGPGLLPGLAEVASASGALPEVAAELLRVRRHMARALLERLVEVRPDPAGVSAAIDAQAAAVAAGADLAALAAADAGVLAALLAASGSPVLQLCLNPVRQVLAGSAPLRASMYQRPRENVAGWRALAAWLADPQPEGIEVVLALLAARDAETVAGLAAAASAAR